MKPGAIVGPLILIALGVLFLLNNAGWDFPIGEMFARGWPLILVFIGLAQLLGGIFSTASGRRGHGSIPGGIILITLGVLFALQQMAGIHFGETWPILLIVIGALGLLRAMLGPALFAGRVVKGRIDR
jgi:hypothetical protein